jgi:hypothetical protein
MMPLINATPAFEQRYASHLKHLKLKGERVRSCFHTLVCLIARPDPDLPQFKTVSDPRERLTPESVCDPR